MKYLVKFKIDIYKWTAGQTDKFDQKRLDKLNAMLAKDGIEPDKVYAAQEAK
jgi:hypothetical protein